jgi:SHS2 domain-containing protein
VSLVVRKFDFIDHTGDTGVIVYGKTLEELFQHAAEAFFEILTEPETIREQASLKISLEGNGLEELLVDWLNEFLFLFDTKGLLFRHFEINSLDEHRLKATVRGETYEEGRHPIKGVIKAVTYHQLKIRRERFFWKVQIIFDL